MNTVDRIMTDAASTTDGAALSRDAGGPVDSLPFVPGYELIREVGRGGMGVVYQARQESLNRTVALKVLRMPAVASADDLGRFRREAEAVARLQHPNILQVFEVGESNGAPYIALEFVDGKSLSQRLNGQPQDPRDAAELVESLARAMHTAHEKQIIHRDLKPSNILIAPSGQPKIADFGLAKLVDEDTQYTKSGVLMGTPCYMAPEQAAGRSHAVTPATDVYALGAILYEMLTGRPPFRGANAGETIEQVLTATVVPPIELRPGLPAELGAICVACLQKDAAKRLPTAALLADELLNWRAGKGCQNVTVLRLQSGRKGRRATGWIVLSLVQLAAIVGLGWLVWKKSNTVPAALESALDIEAKLPVELPEGIAARIELNEKGVKRRVERVRYLGDQDGLRWPEAEESLINSLRGDRHEEVRYEAALALGKGNCASPATLEALTMVCTAGVGDNFPVETSPRVIDAARAALEKNRPLVKPGAKIIEVPPPAEGPSKR